MPEKTKDGKYKCEVCDRIFARSDAVYAHQRRMHGKAPGKERKRNQGTLPCHVCGKTYTLQSNLRRHMREVHE